MDGALLRGRTRCDCATAADSHRQSVWHVNRG